MNEPIRDHIFTLEEFREMRRENPRALLRHIEELRLSFVFGVEDRRDDESRWGGECRLLLNRNLTLHFIPAFNEDMKSIAELPPFCVMPDEDRSDQSVEFEQLMDDGEIIKGVIFYVEPLDYDTYVREAISAFEEYEDWEAVPDSYYLHTDLVKFVTRVVLEHPRIVAERVYDFRLPFVGGKAPPALEEEEYLTAEELISPEGEIDEEEEIDEEREAAADDDDDDDYEPPLEGMRSLPVDWGGL